MVASPDLKVYVIWGGGGRGGHVKNRFPRDQCYTMENTQKLFLKGELRNDLDSAGT